MDACSFRRTSSHSKSMMADDMARSRAEEIAQQSSPSRRGWRFTERLVFLIDGGCAICSFLSSFPLLPLDFRCLGRCTPRRFHLLFPFSLLLLTRKNRSPTISLMSVLVGAVQGQ